MGESIVERAIGLVLLALLVWLVLLIVRPFAGPLIWAITLAVALWPVHLRLRHALGLRSGLAALLLSLALLAAMVLPIVRLAIDLGRQGEELVRLGRELLEAPTGGPPEWLVRAPVIGPQVTSLWESLSAGPRAALEPFLPYLRDALGWLLGLGAALGLVALELLLSVLLTGLLLVHGELCAGYTRRFAERIGGARAGHLVDLAAGTVRAVALGVVGTAIVQALLALAGYLVAGIPAAGLLALLVFAFSLLHLPVTIAVLPVPLWLYYHEGLGALTVLVSIWLLAVALLDNIVRPWLISRGMTLPASLTILGVVGGVLAFGPIGLFFGAVVIALAHRLLLDWLDRPGDPVDRMPGG